MNVFERIKSLANAQGKSIVDVESDLGMSKNYLYKWKKASPNSEWLLKVADYFHVSTDYLLGKEEKKKEHIDVSKILEADQLYLKNTALSEEDRKQVQAVLSALLNSKEGQQRLRERGYKG